MAAASMLGGAVTETPAVARLPGGPLPYTLRRSPRSRGLRVVIHPVRGVVVTVPAAGRRSFDGYVRNGQSQLAVVLALEMGAPIAEIADYAALVPLLDQAGNGEMRGNARGCDA